MSSSPLSTSALEFINDLYTTTGKRHFAIDLASRVVQICYYSFNHKRLINKEIRTNELEKILGEFEPGSLIVGFEACGACHHWARRVQEMGHEYRCFMYKHVMIHKNNAKSDKIDALAIFKALLDRDSKEHSIRCKTLNHQMLSGLMTTRTSMIRQKVKSMNALRAFMYEMGVVFPKDLSFPRMKKIVLNFREEMLQQHGEQSEAFVLFDISVSTYLEHIGSTVETIEKLDKKIEEISRKNVVCQLLRTIPGVGYIIAMMLYIAGYDIGNFKNAKHFAGYCGIAPHVEGTGGMTSSMGIRHYGHREIAGMLYTGAMAHYANTLRKTMEVSENEQVKEHMKKRRKILICAMANHIARTAYAVIRDKKPYVTDKASGLLTVYKECL